MNNYFLFEKVKRFVKDNEISEGDIWRNFEHITYLITNGEINIDDAECYALALFQMVEEVRGN